MLFAVTCAKIVPSNKDGCGVCNNDRLSQLDRGMEKNFN